MTKNRYVAKVIFVFFALTFISRFKVNAQNQPNIVFIVVDDLGWKDLACYGSEFYETPSIDKLASEGIRFTQAYSAHSLCVPSRYALMTGKYPARVLGKERFLSKNDICFSELLNEAGYKTFFAGKWHLGSKDSDDYPLPEKQGFDVNKGGSHIGQPGSYYYPYKGIGKIKRSDGSMADYGVPGLKGGEEGEYLTDRLTDETINFIQKNAKKPFVVMLSHYAVHTPLQATPELNSKYNKKLSGMNPLPTAYIKEGTGVANVHQNHTTYAAMIESVDESVGRIRKTLEQLSLVENTIIVVTSDNGGLSNTGYAQRELATSNLPLRAGKGWLYEGGIRVPLIVYWPGVTKTGTSDALVNGMDYYPTFLEMVGLPLRPDLHKDGISFAPVLKGKANTTRKRSYWHTQAGNPGYVGDTGCSVVRDEEFKLIHWYEEEKIELFNLKEDIGEKNDLSKKMPEKTEELFTELKLWRMNVNAYMKE
jgi:arylsulfatase A-like enzyme